MKKRSIKMQLSQLFLPKLVLVFMLVLLLLTFSLYWNISLNYVEESHSPVVAASASKFVSQLQSQVQSNEIAQENPVINFGKLFQQQHDQDQEHEKEKEQEGPEVDGIDKNTDFDSIENNADGDLVFNSESYLKNAGSEISSRIQRVKSLCQKYHLGDFNYPKSRNRSNNDLDIQDPPTPQYSYFFYNREYNLAWCPIYKAGSTSWLYNMMILVGYSEETLINPPKQLSILAREVYGDELDDETLKNSLKFLVVRHPFERIMSAYKDKLSNSSIGAKDGTQHYYKKYGKKIVTKYRPQGSPLQNGQVEPTFSEFVSYLLDVDLVNSDDHWVPAYYVSTPCRVEYSVIAKTETYMRDQEYLINTAGLTGVVQPRWQHKSTAGQQVNRLGQLYFSQVSRSQVNKLYQKYLLDFELFDYKYEEYLKYAKSD